MALTKISTDGVKDDAITAGKIPANAVGASELADNAVDTNAIANNAVTAGKTSGVQTTINNNADNRVITGSGTANTLEGEADLSFDGTKLGIGTTSPQKTLVAKGDIAQSANASGNPSNDSTLGVFGFLPNAGASTYSCGIQGQAVGTQSGSANPSALLFFTKSSSTGPGSSPTESMRIDASGNVGIGITAPAHKLQIDDSSFTQLYLKGTGNVAGVRFGNTSYTNGHIYYDNGANMNFHTNGSERMRIDSNGYITKPNNPVFHAFGAPTNVAANNDIVFGQERFDVGSGYNTSTGEYTAPVTGYYHFYAQVYRQTDEDDSHWGFYLDTGGGYNQISESRMQNNYGGDSGRGYSTLQLSIYWYMTIGHKIKCRVNNASGDIHCNNILSYFCGNLVG